MPRPNLPNLHRERTRHGALVWYVRIGKGSRIRIRGEYGSPEFKTAYQAAIAGEPAPKPASAAQGSLAWLVARYQDSRAWTQLSQATRKQRSNIIKRVLKTGGAEAFDQITKKTLIAAMDRRKATPFAARNFLETMRGLFRWALKSDLVKVDPTSDLDAARPKSDGFPIWTDDDIAKFQAKWPIGTRERLAFDVLLYTGLRRGDAVTLGRQHIKGGVARLTTEKTGERVFILIEPELAATLAAGPCGDLTFICGENGRALVKESFGNWFGEVCRSAGIRKSAHGLRKAGATRDANDGWTESELEAKYGWRGGQMASKYTRAMNRERLAIQAAKRARANNS
jgi:integrase